MNTRSTSPFSLGNIRCFIAFRIFFNSRFYYPVFTILFLDYGLTIEQFAILNSVWAATIVIAEVPSGALADLLGRKHLLMITSVLMVVEMMLLSFVPLRNLSLVFWAFFLNRILSGLAEAMASGADEALAYDSLMEQGDARDWPAVLSLTMRLKSVIAMVTMAMGALLYDADAVNAILQFFGSSVQLEQHVTMRFPVYLTLMLGFLSCGSVLRMKETGGRDKPGGGGESESEKQMVKLKKALLLTLGAGRWIMATPFALMIILFGMAFDHILRMVITMTSQFLRLVQLPEASFGLISAAMSLVGLFIPKVAEEMVRRYTPLQNVLFLSAFTLLTLAGLALYIPYFGLVPVAMISAGMMFTSFFTSSYLNRITDSYQRATVLSFKGLAFNLAYGLIGIAFAALIRVLREIDAAGYQAAGSVLRADQTFVDATFWFIPYTVVLLLLLVIFSALRFKGHHNYKP
jgi:MFS family permease